MQLYSVQYTLTECQKAKNKSCQHNLSSQRLGCQRYIARHIKYQRNSNRKQQGAFQRIIEQFFCSSQPGILSALPQFAVVHRQYTGKLQPAYHWQPANEIVIQQIQLRTRRSVEQRKRFNQIHSVQMITYIKVTSYGSANAFLNQNHLFFQFKLNAGRAGRVTHCVTSGASSAAYFQLLSGLLSIFQTFKRPFS